MYWVYILKSKDSNQLYIGRTSDIKRRLKEHQTLKNQSTKRYKNWKLVYCEGYLHLKDAILREKNLKYFGKAYSQLKRRIAYSLKSI